MAGTAKQVIELIFCRIITDTQGTEPWSRHWCTQGEHNTDAQKKRGKKKEEKKTQRTQNKQEGNPKERGRTTCRGEKKKKKKQQLWNKKRFDWKEKN